MNATELPTVPARFESSAFIPPSARLTPLAMAALENGVSGDDVRAYLTGNRVRQVPLGESAVGEIIRAVEAGLVLHVAHPNLGGTLTAGISRRADGSRVFETIAHGCSEDVGDTFGSALEMARSFTYQVGNRRPYWAAVEAIAGR